MTAHEAIDLTHLEARLTLERKALLARIEEQLRSYADPKKDALADRMKETGSRALAGLQREIDVSPLGHELSGLREIDEALKRIRDGVYGLCAGCGKPVEPRRLNAQPAVRLCLTCKQAFERRRGIVSFPED